MKVIKATYIGLNLTSDDRMEEWNDEIEAVADFMAGSRLLDISPARGRPRVRIEQIAKVFPPEFRIFRSSQDQAGDIACRSIWSSIVEAALDGRKRDGAVRTPAGEMKGKLAAL